MNEGGVEILTSYSVYSFAKECMCKVKIALVKNMLFVADTLENVALMKIVWTILRALSSYRVKK